MLAILQKTVGPNFKAGDVIRGDNSRIKRLEDKGIVTADHSTLGMAGSIVSFILSGIIFVVAILSFFPWFTWDPTHILLSPLWRWTLLITSSINISLNLAFFINANNPYTAYYMAFATNIFGGILVMAGHEKSVAKYQNKRTSASAAVILFVIGALSFVTAITSNVVWSVNKFNDHITVAHFITWLIYIILLVVGASFAVFYDFDFNKRRNRYIDFLKRKNMTIKYKTNALHAYRAYQKSGNAHKFLEKNIELLEKSLESDRQQIIDKKKDEN